MLSKFARNQITSDYWQKKLEGIAPFLDFPTDRVRATIAASKSKIASNLGYGQYVLELSPTQSNALTNIAQSNHVSLATVLLSAFQVLLYRYTNREDFVVSCLDWWGDRHQINLDILPVRAVVDNKQKFSELLIANRNYLSDASNYPRLSVADSLEALSSNAQLSSTSLFQFLFGFESASTSDAESSAIVPEAELTLNIGEKSQYLSCRFKYDRNLFDRETIRRVADNYQVLLKSIVDNPEASLHSLSLISTAEKEQVLFKWNQTQTEFSFQCVHQLLEARVRENPEAVAIICQEQQLTYGELNTRANQLAHYLQTLEVTPGSLVGLCIEQLVLVLV